MASFIFDDWHFFRCSPLLRRSINIVSSETFSETNNFAKRKNPWRIQCRASFFWLLLLLFNRDNESSAMRMFAHQSQIRFVSLLKYAQLTISILQTQCNILLSNQFLFSIFYQSFYLCIWKKMVQWLQKLFTH